MKIIGQTPSGVILEATKDELANLAGYYSAYDTEFNNKDLSRVGTVVEAHAMYQQLYRLASAKRELETAQKTLRATADLLEPVMPIVDLTKNKESTHG